METICLIFREIYLKGFGLNMKNLILIVKSLRHKAYLAFWHHMPIQKNKILIWANSFHTYGDSPKYITEYLLEHASGQYDIVWVFETGITIPKDLPKGIRVVRYFSMDYLREISTSKFIICNARTGPYHYFNKRPEQVYIQTWHSSLRLKMIEGDAHSLPASYIEAAKVDSKKIDLLLSGCSFSSKIFRRAFWYNGEIMEGGTPRCDIFFGSKKRIRDKIYQYYHIPTDRMLALYAPTFRDSKVAQTHGLDFARLSQVLCSATGDLWVIGCRYHPNLKDNGVPVESISMTAYPDMQELITAADLLITDYSSCMFDMALRGGACILFTPDLETYTAKERALYFPLDKLPFPVARNMTELEQKIMHFDMSTYQSHVGDFLNNVGNFEDGHASARVADYIEQKRRT